MAQLSTIRVGISHRIILRIYITVPAILNRISGQEPASGRIVKPVPEKLKTRCVFLKTEASSVAEGAEVGGG